MKSTAESIQNKIIYRRVWGLLFLGNLLSQVLALFLVQQFMQPSLFVSTQRRTMYRIHYFGTA